MDETTSPIVLINLAELGQEYGGRSEHLGLAYLASYLRQANYPVHIFDADAMEWSDEQVIDKTVPLQPMVVGITVYNRMWHRLPQVAAEIRRYLPQVHITIGGLEVTLRGIEALESLEGLVDSAVLGEGEITLLELVNAVQHGRTLDSIQGLCYWDRGTIKQNQSRERIFNLDTLPFPARDTLEQMIKLGEDAFRRPTFAPGILNVDIVTSRGCTISCSFCAVFAPWKNNGRNTWVARSAEDVLAEIAQLMGRHNFQVLYFNDPLFFGHRGEGKQRAREIAQGMIERDLRIPFRLVFRSDVLGDNEQEDIELFQLLKQAGLVSVFIGIEGGTYDSLKTYQKATNVDQNWRALRFMQKVGLMVEFGYIPIHPLATLDEVRGNVDFLCTAGHGQFLSNLSRTTTIYYNTPLARMAEAHGLLESDAKERYGLESRFGWGLPFKYKDPRVGKLHFMLWPLVGIPEVAESIQALYTSWFLEGVISALYKNKMSVSDKNNFWEYQQRANQQRAEIARINHKFVTTAISLVEEGTEDELFQPVRDQYLKTLSEHTGDVWERFVDLAQYMDVYEQTGTDLEHAGTDLEYCWVAGV